MFNSEKFKEYEETVAQVIVQYALDEIRMFVINKTNLDPVYAFNPSIEELNDMYKTAQEYLDGIRKGFCEEDNQ